MIRNNYTTEAKIAALRREQSQIAQKTAQTIESGIIFLKVT